MANPWTALPEAHAVIDNFGVELKQIRSKSSAHDGGERDTSDEDSLEREQRVNQLARRFTQASIKNPKGEYVNPFLSTDDPTLDPTSDKFSARAWVKTLVGIQSRDPERYPDRTAGVSYHNLSCHGFGDPMDYQKTFGNYPLEVGGLFNKITGRGKRKIQILRHFDGIVKSGEMLVVLGRPGSGCSTLLKTIAGETAGFYVDSASQVNYQGIPMEMMHNDFRGETMYQAEVDVHFPQLTVGQTLDFAAKARAPRNRIPGVSRERYAEHMRDVVMAMFGLSHTLHTKVGNDFIRGVSGGERKRVSIAEAVLAGCPINVYDNATRGLDSATALEFVKTLRTSTSLQGSTAVVAIYQASQSIYDVFDKVSVLYEGRQIYFGDIHKAKEFYVNLGFDCPERQTTADFLTSLTSPSERTARPGYERLVPRTPDEFVAAWKKSVDYTDLMAEIEAFERQYPVGGEQLQKFKEAKKAVAARGQRIKSPYTLSVPMQVKLCLGRAFQRLRGDMTLLLTGWVSNGIMALVIGSVFYNLPHNTGALYSRGALLFFAILLNAFSSALEILTLFQQRPIVEKHTKYAFYHPFSEAIASMICDLPNKIGTSIFFNVTLYFITNLRRTPEAFFTFLLFSFTMVMCMSMIFRSIGSLSRSMAQAMAPAAVFILALIIYTGFTIPVPYMKPWFRWINYLDPVGYAFESLMINEFSGQQIPCSQFIPAGPPGSPYANAGPLERVCAAAGSLPGQAALDGDRYLALNYQYYRSHLWRNYGIILALMIFGLAVHLIAVEYISAKRSKGEVLLFPRGKVPDFGPAQGDAENIPDDRATADMMAVEKVATEVPASIQKQTAVFHWSDVDYEIKVKGGTRMLLNKIDGWVKPGTLTALMGVSGAGKTTLLDVLASRVTMGVVTGEMLVDGRQRNSGFQRKTGYVQQQDLHLATSTVREALTFSAVLRQPKTTPYAERVAYVDEVIKLLEMESYADAVVGVPGEGLNVEQRKRLTIGVEMAAKPALLLFLDEPTSGLDSQTAWSIVQLLRKLANNGQAILCTIHQPSAILFQEFDRLLFLARGGKTVYFGEVGDKSKILTDYFERNGARPIRVEENPAEWMLEVIGAAPGSQTDIDWYETWNGSAEKAEVKRHLAQLKADLSAAIPQEHDPMALRSFAATPFRQLITVTQRIFEQLWRTPNYLYSKVILCASTGLFIGFSFYNSPTSVQGLQNQLFAVFMLLTIFGNLVQQIMPHFVVQRSLYEVRERPSKTYSWPVFMLSNIIVELPWQTLMSVIIFVSWYYPIGLNKNAIPADQVAERGGLMFLLIFAFMIFTSTFTHMVIAAVDSAETGGNIANLLFSLTLVFCGVLAGPTALPGFWIFMYRVSPFTYLVDGMISVGLANTDVICSDVEYLTFNPPSGQTCAQYLQPYISAAGGYVTQATMNATENCQLCPMSDTNIFLSQISSSYSHRWRNFGLMWVYIVFNVFGAIFLYWLARVPKGKKTKEKAE
jgi:ATP-binding cassette subfamily G (WHITE) protein 2 (PDR)